MKTYNMIKLSPTNYILVTDSASEPVTLTEVKTYLRIDGTDYDNILTPLITTARQLAEKITGRDMINKTWKTYLDYFAFGAYPSSYTNIVLNSYGFFESGYAIELAKSKLQSITSIKYLVDDVLTVYDSSNYYITNESDYSSIYLTSSATAPTVDVKKQAVEIIFVSGYGASSSDVPQALRQAILAHIAYLFNNPDDCDSSGNALANSIYAPYIVTNKLFYII